MSVCPKEPVIVIRRTAFLSRWLGHWDGTGSVTVKAKPCFTPNAWKWSVNSPPNERHLPVKCEESYGKEMNPARRFHIPLNSPISTLMTNGGARNSIDLIWRICLSWSPLYDICLDACKVEYKYDNAICGIFLICRRNILTDIVICQCKNTF